MRITRPGFQTWSRNVNLREGFHLVAALEFTPEGLAQWKQMSQFMQDLKDKAKLSDAKAELVRGAAQLLRQSGYRVDTKEAPATIIQNGSIWEPVIPVRPRTIQGPGPVIIQQGSTDAAALQPAAAATSAATAAEQTLLIQIDAEGKLRHGTEALNIEELPALIKTAQTAAAQGGRSLRVHLLASPQASYGAIAPVIEALKKQGVTNLELLSDASVQPAAKAPAVTVSLKGDGLVYWNGKAVSEDALDKQFADAAAAGVREITLQAAPSIPLRRTMPIVDKAKANHISVRFEELR